MRVRTRLTPSHDTSVETPVRDVPAGPARNRGAASHREAGRHGPHVGRRRPRDPQSAGSDHPGQCAAGGGPARARAQRSSAPWCARTRSGWRRSSTRSWISRGCSSACCRLAGCDRTRSARWPRPAVTGAMQTRSGSRRAAGARGARRRRALRRRPPAPHPREPAGQRAALRRPNREVRSGVRPQIAAGRASLQVWSDGAPLDAQRCSATSSSPSSLRKAAPAAWASSSAASCASATAPAIGYAAPRGSAGNATRGQRVHRQRSARARRLQDAAHLTQ